MKNRILLILAIILIAVTPLAAETSKNETFKMVLYFLGPALATIGGVLAQRLFKKLGIDISKDEVEKAINKIIAYIVDVEKQAQKSPTKLTGDQKFDQVVAKANRLPKKQKSALIAKYGSIEDAVEVVFQQTAVALKNKMLKTA